MNTLILKARIWWWCRHDVNKKNRLNISQSFIDYIVKNGSTNNRKRCSKRWWAKIQIRSCRLIFLLKSIIIFNMIFVQLKVFFFRYHVFIVILKKVLQKVVSLWLLQFIQLLWFVELVLFLEDYSFWI
jgi:hypothetical protein